MLLETLSCLNDKTDLAIEENNEVTNPFPIACADLTICLWADRNLSRHADLTLIHAIA